MKNLQLQKIISKNKRESSPSIRNKELTKRLFIDAAGSIIRKHGINALGINRVAQEAGRSKRMIYDYFGNMEGLLRALLKESDYWLNEDEVPEKIIEIHKEDQGRELAAITLKKHFHQFCSDPLLQEISLMEISVKSDFLLEISRARERYAEQLFKLTDEYFKNTDVHSKSIEALLIGGINYIVLHAKIHDNSFCGIDINNPDHQSKLLKTLEQITNWAYDHVKKEKSKIESN